MSLSNTNQLLHFNNFKKNAKNEMRIGVIPSFPSSFLHNFTLGLWKERTVSGHIIHGSLPELINRLDKKEIDMILSDAPLARKKLYKSINLGTQKLIVVASEEFEKYRNGFPRSLDKLPYISFSRNEKKIQEDINFFFKSNDITPMIIGTADDPAFMCIATANSHCFSILPEGAVSNFRGAGKLIELGHVKEVVSNYWAIMPGIQDRQASILKLINNYVSQ